MSAPRPERTQVVSYLRAREAGREPDVRAFRSDVLAGRLLSLEELTPWLASKANGNGGGLTRLRALAAELAGRHGWEASDATAFVLTGLAPVTQPVQARVEGGWPSSSTTRIVLEVDPTVDPRTVMKRYGSARRQLIAGRVREPAERLLRLVVFAEDHRELPWEERRERWNHAHPKWAYTDLAAFKRDARLTHHRLLEPPW
jgi:hypothetical protein